MANVGMLYTRRGFLAGHGPHTVCDTLSVDHLHDLHGTADRSPCRHPPAGHHESDEDAPGGFPCWSGEKANHTAGGSVTPVVRSSRTYVQNRPIFIFFLPGADTGVSSVCSLRVFIT